MRIHVIITHKNEAFNKEWEYKINDVEYKQWNEVSNGFAKFVIDSIKKINGEKEM